MGVVNYGLLFIVSYIIGSIPNGLFIGKLFNGIDIRQFGSKNIGATNIFRVLGPWPALCVLITDMLKGIVGVYLGRLFFGTPLAEVIGGIAAIMGHNWSVFLKLKGGRGVATGLGVITVLVPKVTVAVFIVWTAIVFTTRYVSLGSIVAAALVPMGMYFTNVSTEVLVFGIFAAAFVIIRHRPNIERLLKGQELKIKPGKLSSPKEK